MALTLLLVVPGVASAQSVTSTVAASLRVEWERPASQGGKVEGYVYNDSAYRVGTVRLRVTTRDNPDAAPTDYLTWVYGNVPARGRFPFFLRVPRDKTVVSVTIESFDVIARDAPTESP